MPEAPTISKNSWQHHINHGREWKPSPLEKLGLTENLESYLSEGLFQDTKTYKHTCNQLVQLRRILRPYSFLKYVCITKKSHQSFTAEKQDTSSNLISRLLVDFLLIMWLFNHTQNTRKALLINNIKVCIPEWGKFQKLHGNSITSSYKSIGGYRWSRQSCNSCHNSGHSNNQDRQTFRGKRLKTL